MSFIDVPDSFATIEITAAGPPGPPGPPGPGIRLRGTVPTYSALPGSPQINDAWVTADNLHMYAWIGEWLLIGYSRGPQGPSGPPGSWVQVTRAQYAALDPPDAGTLYIVID